MFSLTSFFAAPSRQSAARFALAVALLAATLLTACAPQQRRTTSAASGNATNTTASAPANTAAASPAAQVELTALNGMDGASIDALLGTPDLVRHDGAAEIRLYRGAAADTEATPCSLHVFLYPRDGRTQATYLETRSGGKRLSGPASQLCFTGLRRGAPRG